MATTQTPSSSTRLDRGARDRVRGDRDCPPSDETGDRPGCEFLAVVRAEGWWDARPCDPPPRPPIFAVPDPPRFLRELVAWMLMGVAPGKRTNVQTICSAAELLCHRYPQARQRSAGRPPSGAVRSSWAYMALEAVNRRGECKMDLVDDRFEAKNKKGHVVGRALGHLVRAGAVEKFVAVDERDQARATDLHLQPVPAFTREQLQEADRWIEKWKRTCPWRIDQLRASLRRMKKKNRKPSWTKLRRDKRARDKARGRDRHISTENGTTLRGTVPELRSSTVQVSDTGGNCGLFQAEHVEEWRPARDATGDTQPGPISSRGEGGSCWDERWGRLDASEQWAIAMAETAAVDEQIPFSVVLRAEWVLTTGHVAPPLPSPLAAGLDAAGARHDRYRGPVSSLRSAQRMLKNVLKSGEGAALAPSTPPGKDRGPGSEPSGEEPVADRGRTTPTDRRGSGQHSALTVAAHRWMLDVLEELGRRNTRERSWRERAPRRARRGDR